MRPLELRLRNFRSYAGEHVFDLRGRRLVAIVGPTGSGKSSILDAIAFALYARTPRAGRTTSELIGQRSEEATVTLRFRVDGREWEVQRQLKRRGAGQHLLTDEDGGVRLTMKAEVDRRIEQLLGLDFAAFTRSVLLAQGRFAEFLEARPGERDQVLKGVFGHDRVDRMREVARRRANEENGAADELGPAIGGLDEVRGRLAELEARRRDVAARAERLREAAPAVAEWDAAIRRSGETDAEVRQRREALDRLALPPRRRVGELVAEVVAGEAELETAAELVARRERLLATAEAALGELGEEERLLVEAARQVALLERSETESRSAREDVARAEARRAEAGTAAERAETAARRAAERAETVAGRLESLRAAEAAAETTLEAARRAHMADALRLHLHPGDPCPVCRRPVAEVPAPGGGDVAAASAERDRLRAARAAAEAEAQAARAAAQEAAGSAATARRRVADAVATVEQAAATAAARAAEVVALREEVTKLLGDGDPGELLGRRRRRLATAREEVTTARRELDDARRRHAAALTARQEAEAALLEARSRMAGVAAALGRTLRDVPAAGLPEALAELEEALLAEVRRLEERSAAADAMRREAEEAKARLLGELGLSGSFEAARSAVEREEAILQSEIAAARRRLEEGATLVARHAEHRRRGRLYETLAGELTDSRFVRHLLDADRRRLAELGSDRFAELSNGRYRFTEDGTFDVVDLAAAGSRRRADSLSGGETFLASLALALGLAEMVTRGGGRLDAFLLDEGFGSLDPEHLDLALDGIESLVASHADRLVVVVSHVAALRERVEDLIVLDRDPITGTTEVRHA